PRTPPPPALPAPRPVVAPCLVPLRPRPAIFLGTSYGGLLAMMLAVWRPAAIGGAILNDIGPVSESRGWMRIKGYVGKLPVPRNFEEGAEILGWWLHAQFAKLTPQELITFAQRTWREDRARLAPPPHPQTTQTLRA